MQITFTAAESKFIRKEIECGACSNERAVIRESLKLFKAPAEEKGQRFNALIRKGFDDVAAGRCYSLEETQQKLAEHKAAWLLARQQQP